jgi:hypothetical protein
VKGDWDSASDNLWNKGRVWERLTDWRFTRGRDGASGGVSSKRSAISDVERDMSRGRDEEISHIELRVLVNGLWTRVYIRTWRDWDGYWSRRRRMTRGSRSDSEGSQVW